MTQKSKNLPTAEIINKFTTYNAEMNAAMRNGDFNLANEYIEKMEALCEEDHDKWWYNFRPNF